MTRVAVFAAAFAAAFAALAFACDALAGRLVFPAIAAGALALAAWACRDARVPSPPPRPRGPAPAIFFLGTLALLLAPTPGLAPLSLDWDGANHLALANFLATHGSHAEMVREGYELSWGGDLSSYPWGMHALVACAARIAGANAYAVVYPLFALALALAAGALGDRCARAGGTPFSLALCAAVLLLSKFTLFYLVHFDFWSQGVGILLLVALIAVADDAERFRARPALPALLLGGIALCYPLFAPAAFGGLLLHAAVSRRWSAASLAGALLSGGAIGALYALPTLGANASRVADTGPAFFGGLSDPATRTALLLHALLLARLSRIRRPEGHALAFPLAVALFAAFLAGAAVLADLNAAYWSGKLVATNELLLLPLLAALARAGEGALRARVPSQPLRAALLCAVFALVVVALPPRSVSRLEPALRPDAVALRLWTHRALPGIRVRYAASPYEVAWIEALAETPAVLAGEDFAAAAVALKKRFRPGPGAADALARGLAPGSFVVTDGALLPLPAKAFEVVHQVGTAVLYRRR